MNASWGITPQAQSNGESVVTIVAGPVQFTGLWTPSFQADGRFRVSFVCNDQASLADLIVSANPEALFLHAMLFSGPAEFSNILTKAKCPVYVVFPDTIDADSKKFVSSMAQVKAVFIESQVNRVELFNRILSDVTMQRNTDPVRQMTWTARQNQAAVGLREIVVWNRCGGAGRSTISAALGQAAAARGYSTLLVGLDSPDTLPVLLGINPSPNLAVWGGSPMVDGLRASVQTVGDLSVICGYNSTVDEEKINAGQDAKNSIYRLVDIATKAERHSVIILDTPQSYAQDAIAAANTLLLVARPTMADAFRTVDAYRTVTECMRGPNAIDPKNIFVVLNQCNDALMSADRFQEACTKMLKNLSNNNAAVFPPIIGSIPYLVDVPQASNNGKPPLTASEGFARAINRVADTLFGKMDNAEIGGRTVMNFLGLKIRSK